MNNNKYFEVDTILKKAEPFANHPLLKHLTNKAAVLEYVRLADIVKQFCNEGDEILDWGCGFGQMSWLMSIRGLKVIPYDIVCPSHFEDLGFLPRSSVVYDEKGFPLPFDNNKFDAVLSCGVLEHTPNDISSLVEIKRVLRCGGYFFVFNLPQKTSYVEWIARLSKNAIHDKLYTVNGIKTMLEDIGFKVVKIGRANMLPKRLARFPDFIRKFYGNMGEIVVRIDRSLSALPIINKVASTLSVIAVRK